MLQAPTSHLLLQRIAHRLQLLPDIVAHANRHAAKDLRWRAFKRTQATLDRLCLSFTGGDRDTIVAYGAAEFNHALRGNRSVPTARVRRRLQDFARVFYVDERMTSQLCSACHHRMRGAQFGAHLSRQVVACQMHVLSSCSKQAFNVCLPVQNTAHCCQAAPGLGCMPSRSARIGGAGEVSGTET